MKVRFAKTLVSQSKNLQWENIAFDSYNISNLGYYLYKRKISLNYWRFTVSDGTTSCAFTMYEKEKKNDS